MRRNMIATCGTRTTKMADDKTAYENIGFRCDGLFIPLGGATDPSLQKRNQFPPYPLVTKVLLVVFMGYVSRAVGGWSREFTHRGPAKTWKTCHPPKFTAKGSNTKNFHKKERCRTNLRRHLSNSSTFLDPTVAKGLLVRNLEQHEK